MTGVAGDVVAIPRYEVGQQFAGPTRILNSQRATWYSVGQLSAAMGRPMPPKQDIHTDPELAAQQGLSAVIANGMHSTSWIGALLAETFGIHYAAAGALRTKYIKPVIVGRPLTARAVVTAVDEAPVGIVGYRLDVWAEDDEGTRLTIGEATVRVDPTLGGIVKGISE